MKKSELGLGTWGFGPSFGFWEDQVQSDSTKTLRLALKSGLRHFDSAPSYGSGKAEQLLGSQLKTHPNRASLTIATKCMPKLGPFIRKDLEKSLARLQTTYIDILYLHWPSSTLPTKAVVKELVSLKEEGLIRSVGVSNTPLGILEQLQGIGIDYLQIPATLIWTRSLESLRLYAQGQGIALVGYSPLGSGTLAHNPPPNDERAKLYVYSDAARGAFGKLLLTLEEIAQERLCKAEQVALLWARSQGFSTILVGARNETQLKQSLATDTLELNEADLKRLDACSERLCRCAPPNWDNYFGHRW